jgi:hypothetical protein
METKKAVTDSYQEKQITPSTLRKIFNIYCSNDHLHLFVDKKA